MKRRREREARPKPPKKQFTLEDLVYDEANETCFCPAGQKLYKERNRHAVQWLPRRALQGADHRLSRLPASQSVPAASRAEAAASADRDQRSCRFTTADEGHIERGRRAHAQKFDTPAGRATYSKRIGIVEPVFGNIQNKDMRRFTLRGRAKLNAQWQLFTIVHNIEKITRVPRE